LASTETGIAPEPLDVTALIASASDPACGAVASFIGTVRESAAVPGNSAKPVTMLEYEAHPTLAVSRIEEIAREAATKWGLERVVAVHRTGPCPLGEPTVVVACGAAHRGEALEACHWIIDTIKASVPIWKKEIYADGSSWVGSEGA
jgi:molybdopterin synthase catalytic subunit